MIRPSILNRRLALAAVMLLSSAGLARAADAPAVLKEVPDNAQVVVVVKDIKGLATKISTMATRLSLPVPQDLVGFITKNIGVKEGLDQNGSMALVLMPGKKAEGEEGEEQGALRPEPLILIPTTDAKAMLAAFKPEPPEKGVSEVKMPNDPDEKGYVAVVNKHVVLAEKREHVQRYLAHKGAIDAKLSAETLAAINSNDVAVYANIPEINKSYGKTVDDALQLVAMTMDLKGGGEDGGIGMAVGKEAATLYFKAIRSFLTDAESSLLTIRLTDSGVTFGASGTFKKDSAWGKFIAAQKPNREVTLKGLPAAGPIWAAGSVYMDSGNVTSILAALLDRLSANPALKEGEKKGDLEQTTKALEIQKQMAALSSGGAFAVYGPSDPEKAGWVHAAFVIESTDSAKYLDLVGQLAKLGSVDTSSTGVKTQVAIKANARTVQGVSVNEITVKFSARDAEPSEETKEALKVLKAAGGEDGIHLHTAAVGNRVVMVLSSDPKLLEAALEAAKKDSDALGSSKEITGVKAQVLKNPSMVVYLPVDRWIQVAKSRKAEKPAEGAEPAIAFGDAPPTPLVISANVEGQTARFELFLPISTLTTAVETVKSEFGFLFGI